MLPYYDEEEDLKQCQAFCALWSKDFPELRADMYRLLLDVIDGMPSMNVYAFSKKQMPQDYWTDALKVISSLAEWQVCSIQTILDTMPSHLFVPVIRTMYVHLTIGGVSTAKTIIKHYGTEPEVFVNDHEVKMVKQGKDG